MCKFVTKLKILIGKENYKQLTSLYLFVNTNVMFKYIVYLLYLSFVFLFASNIFAQPKGYVYVGHINEYNLHKDVPKDRASNRGYLIGIEGSLSKKGISPIFGLQYRRFSIAEASIGNLFNKKTKFLDKFGFRLGMETPIVTFSNIVIRGRGLVSGFQIIDYDEDAVLAQGSGLPVEGSYFYSFGAGVDIYSFSLDVELSTQFQDNYPEFKSSKAQILSILLGINF